MSVTVCIIARNEEGRIAQAIRSVRGLADHVIVVDTGSTDGTVEVARAEGAVVMTGSDRWNKAAARNAAIDLAPGAWVVVLDCDEQIADPDQVRAYLDTTSAGAVYVRISYRDHQNRETFSFHQMRAWRRGAMRYKYRAHEVPIPTGQWPEIATTNFVWEHRHTGDNRWKRPYTLARLILDVDEHPGDTRPLYYLGREYCYVKAYELGRETLRKYLGMVTSDTPDYAEALGFIAESHWAEGDADAALEAYSHAHAAQPDRREWLGKAAEIEYARGNYDVAASLLARAVVLPRPLTGYVVESWYGPHPYDLLARSLYRAGMPEKARGFGQRAVDLDPGNERLIRNLAYYPNPSQA